ncbi:MAG: CPBP family intramembrane metalloprotease [Bacteroidota bacterium]|nr:CPBP family intramembrane metalloprotease [Bacteroidota bacterium]
MSETEPQYPSTTDFEIQRTPYPDVQKLVTLFFIILLNTVIVAIPAGIVLAIFPKMPFVYKSLFNIVLYVAPMLLSINYALRKSKKQQGYAISINFNKIQGWLVPVVIIGTLALIIPLEWLSDLIPMPDSVKKVFEEAFTKDVFSIATVSIAAPILEEILCRGIILNGLLKNYPPFKAILISAIFFGATHLNPWQALPAFIGGMYLGWLYNKTQSVIPGMIIHFTINFTASMMLFLPGPEQELSAFMGMHNYILAILASVVVFAGICIIINKKAYAIADPLFHVD